MLGRFYLHANLWGRIRIISVPKVFTGRALRGRCQLGIFEISQEARRTNQAQLRAA